MDELEDLHADRTNKSFYHYGSWGRGLISRKASLRSRVIYNRLLHLSNINVLNFDSFFNAFSRDNIRNRLLHTNASRYRVRTSFRRAFHGKIHSFKKAMSRRARGWEGGWGWGGGGEGRPLMFFNVICYLYSSEGKPFHNAVRHFACYFTQ